MNEEVLNTIPNEDNKSVIQEEFYTNKFMVIQQSNVVLWRKLQKLRDDPELRDKIETSMGEDFFKDINELLI